MYGKAIQKNPCYTLQDLLDQLNHLATQVPLDTPLAMVQGPYGDTLVDSLEFTIRRTQDPLNPPNIVTTNINADSTKTWQPLVCLTDNTDY